MKQKEHHLFHVHTYRCKHASNERDELYINKAIELGATKITFTDHVPFPNDPFPNKMDFSQLDEYISTLSNLKENYADQIEIRIGLECDYFPNYYDYYKTLKEMPGIDLLILGQHFYGNENGTYSFNDSREYYLSNVENKISDAIFNGIKSGLFDVVAHPERYFRNKNKWTPTLTKFSNKIIKSACDYNVKLEINISSILSGEKANYYRPEFWKLVDNFKKETGRKIETILGTDAHSTEELKLANDFLLLKEQGFIFKK